MNTDGRFVHLHVHTDYSFHDGLMDVKAVVKKAQELGMPAVAITDRMNQCNSVKLYEECIPRGIKPIFGIELCVYDDTVVRGKKEFFTIELLALNEDGYHNIVELQADGYRQGIIDYNICVPLSKIKERSFGVAALSGSIDGDVGKYILEGRLDLAEKRAAMYKTFFPDSYYLELTRMDRPGEERYIEAALKLAQKLDLPVIATNYVQFAREEDYEIHNIRVAIQDKVTLADKNWHPPYTPKMYMRSQEEMAELFRDIPEAVQNTVYLAARCSVYMHLGKNFLPKFPTGGLSDAEFLKKESYQGLEQRLEFMYQDPEVRRQKRLDYLIRLEKELKVIIQMDFPGYFLIVMEFIQWSKKHDIPVGPGRGSGGGSLVAFCIGITDFDPLPFDLLFERFLNPERVSMPDFDVDFCMDNRGKVIQHVADLYGRQSVSQIITFGTLAAKASVKAVARVMGKSYSFGDRLAKLLPKKVNDKLDYTLTEALAPPKDPADDAAKAFREKYAEDEEIREVVDKAIRVEGLTTSHGKHAGGVVISPSVITDFAPLMCDDDGGDFKTQFDKHDVEEAGLVKFDFLGLRTLTIIRWALDMINERMKREGKPLVDIRRIDLADPLSYEVLKTTETTAVFQLESRGMRELIGKLQPDCFEDIIALVALYRPGPLGCGLVDNFVNRKHGKEEIAYPDPEFQHPCLEPILKPTYGVIIYQEQVMQIAQAMAGYSLGGADILRRAMGKKQMDVMQKQRAKFRAGAVEKGIDGDLAMKIFDMVEKFAKYGFNKSHSAAYALVCFQTLWLKAHYPAEFLAAMMTADKENADKVVSYINECRRLKIPVDPPDINEGNVHFIVNDKGHIVFSLAAVKGVGEWPVKAIMEERKKKPFTSIFDLCRRIDRMSMSRRVLEALIKAGSLDRIGPHRAALMAAVDAALRLNTESSKDRESGEMDLFGGMMFSDIAEPPYPEVKPYPDKINLSGEVETLGLYLTGHPMDRYRNEVLHFSGAKLGELRASDGGYGEEKKKVIVAGIIQHLECRTTKSGNQFMQGRLIDYTGEVLFSLWRDKFDKYRNLVRDDMLAVFYGTVGYDNYNKGVEIRVDEIINICEARHRYGRAVRICLNDTLMKKENEMNLIRDAVFRYPGSMPLEILYEKENGAMLVQSHYQVEPCDELLDDLRYYCDGKAAVSYVEPQKQVFQV